MTMKMCRLFHCGVPHETLGTLPDLPLPVFPHATPGSRRKSLRFVMFMDRLQWIGFSSHDLSTQCFAEISLSHGDLSIWEPLRPLNVCDLLVPASKCQKNWEKLEETVSQLQRTGYLVSNHGICGKTYGTYVSKLEVWGPLRTLRTQGGPRASKFQDLVLRRLFLSMQNSSLGTEWCSGSRSQ